MARRWRARISQGRSKAAQGGVPFDRQDAEAAQDMPHVISLIHLDNALSIRVAERVGEKLEGKTEVLGMPVLIYGIDRPRKTASA